MSCLAKYVATIVVEFLRNDPMYANWSGAYSPFIKGVGGFAIDRTIYLGQF